MIDPLVYIILVNFNGWRDTLDCLDSLKKVTYPNFKVLIIDNDSKDESCEKIEEWISKNMFSVSLIKNKSNDGFAGGNNIGIRIASENNSDFVLLLNNDTLVEPEFLNHLVSFMVSNIDYAAVCPQIRYANPSDKIWNCGGNFYSLGFRKYFYGEENISKVPNLAFFNVTYITGCALFYRYKEIGPLTERFFFGEEDVEMSLRIKDAKKKMACIPKSIIYHKVSSSVKKNFNKRLSQIYIYYLSRMIHFRIRWNNSIKWHTWFSVYSFYIVFLLSIKQNFSFKSVLRLLSALYVDSRKNNNVTKQMFLEAFNRF